MSHYRQYRHRIWCNTDQRWEYKSGDPPTACPINAAHSVDLTKVKTIGSEKFEPEDTLTNFNKIVDTIPPVQKGKILTVSSASSKIEWQYPYAHRIRNFTFGATNYSSQLNPIGSGIVKNTNKNSTVSTVIGTFIFDGTIAEDSINSVKAIVYDVAGNMGTEPITANIKLMYGSTTITTLTINNQTTPIQLMANSGNILTTSNISNLPTTEKIIRIVLELALGEVQNSTYYIGVTQIIINL